MIGRHIIFDGFTNSKKFLTNDGIYDFMIEAVREVNMTVLMPPIIVKFPYGQDLLLKVYNEFKHNSVNCNLKNDIEKYIINTNTQLSGYSGTLILMESHLALHTFPDILHPENPDYFLISLDLYSCKDYNGESFVEYLRRTSGFEYFNYKNIKREKFGGNYVY